MEQILSGGKLSEWKQKLYILLVGKWYILVKRIAHHVCGKNGKYQVWTRGQIYDKSWTVFDMGSNICHAQWHVQGETSNISKFIQTHINLGDFEGFISRCISASLYFPHKPCSIPPAGIVKSWLRLHVYCVFKLKGSHPFEGSLQHKPLYHAIGIKILYNPITELHQVRKEKKRELCSDFFWISS